MKRRSRSGWIPKPLYIRLRRMERQLTRIRNGQKFQDALRRIEVEGELDRQRMRSQQDSRHRWPR